MTSLSTSLKARLVDEVTELGEELTAKQIVERIKTRKADEVGDCVLHSQSIGTILANHLGRKFTREYKQGESSKWTKVAP